MGCFDQDSPMRGRETAGKQLGETAGLGRPEGPEEYRMTLKTMEGLSVLALEYSLVPEVFLLPVPGGGEPGQVRRSADGGGKRGQTA